MWFEAYRTQAHKRTTTKYTQVQIENTSFWLPDCEFLDKNLNFDLCPLSCESVGPVWERQVASPAFLTPQDQLSRPGAPGPGELFWAHLLKSLIAWGPGQQGLVCGLFLHV